MENFCIWVELLKHISVTFIIICKNEKKKKKPLRKLWTFIPECTSVLKFFLLHGSLILPTE